MQQNTIEFIKNIRNIYLYLNKNFTQFLKLDLLGSKKIDLQNIFDRSLIHEYRKYEKEVKTLYKNSKYQETLDFSEQFDFTIIDEQKQFSETKITEQINRLITQKKSHSQSIRMISLGIGDGSAAFKYAQKLELNGGWDTLIGFDLHKSYLKQAKKKIVSLKSHSFDLNNLSSTSLLPCDDDSVDIVECSMVAHHIENFKTLIMEIKRVLKQKGYFFYIDLIDKTIHEQKMIFVNDHEYPPFHGVEFFRDHKTILAIINQDLSLCKYIRIGPGIVFLSARKD